MYFATTATSDFTTTAADLSLFFFFSLLSGLLVATVVHLISNTLAENRMLKVVQSFGSGLVVTVVLNLVISAAAGTNGQNSIAQAVVNASGLAVSSAAALTGDTFTLLQEAMYGPS